MIVTIPDFMHATAAIWCMERGKHVYVQKPLTRTICEARLMMDAAAKYKRRDADGQPGLLERRHAAGAEIIWSGEIGNVTRSSRLDRPPMVAAGTHGDSRARPGSSDARLGPLAGQSRTAAVHHRRQGISQPVRQFLSAVQLARLFRFRLRRARRHGVPHSGRAEYGAQAGRAFSHQRRVLEKRGNQQLHVPQEIAHPVRFSGVRQHAAREGLLA